MVSAYGVAQGCVEEGRGRQPARPGRTPSAPPHVRRLTNNPIARYRELGSDFHTLNLGPARKTRDLVRRLKALGRNPPSPRQPPNAIPAQADPQPEASRPLTAERPPRRTRLAVEFSGQPIIPARARQRARSDRDRIPSLR
ncbi:hypothetical protein GCM10012280_49520 [Wenjunlia tyrosinilytica]|uniref:Uncharacterized protein n=1 Tax=Wenjunlia tyrosinilytica TaxID=1544741 RepID=A0A918E0Y8_9ACTN|nr:hypothetical protein GCM10012280_49520 [Wenjunlia tyrosinilytica]